MSPDLEERKYLQAEIADKVLLQGNSYQKQITKCEEIVVFVSVPIS
jgi:hypothetical protein